MSYDHSAGAETKQQFLCRLLEIDVDNLIEAAIVNEMERMGLHIIHERPLKDAAECGYSEIPLHRIEFYDGRIFEHRCTEVNSGDDWGCDRYEYVDVSVPYELKTTIYVWEDYDERKIESVQTFLPVTEETSGPDMGEDNDET